VSGPCRARLGWAGRPLWSSIVIGPCCAQAQMLVRNCQVGVCPVGKLLGLGTGLLPVGRPRLPATRPEQRESYIRLPLQQRGAKPRAPRMETPWAYASLRCRGRHGPLPRSLFVGMEIWKWNSNYLPTRSWFALFVLRGSFIVSNYTTITRFFLTGLFTVNI
jgi:hypothetical protein